MEVVEQEAQPLELERVAQAERNVVGAHPCVGHLLGGLCEAVGPDLRHHRDGAGDDPRLLDRLLELLVAVHGFEGALQGHDVDVGRDAIVRIGIGEPHRAPEPCRGLGIGTGALGRFGQRVGPPAGEDRHAQRQVDELTSLAGLGDLVVGEPVGAQEVDELGPHGLNVHT